MYVTTGNLVNERNSAAKMKCRNLNTLMLFVLNLAFISFLLVWYRISKFVPHVPAASPGAIQMKALMHDTLPDNATILPCPEHLQMSENITRLYDRAPQVSPWSGANFSRAQEFNEKILILTPVSNSANKLQHYFTMLCTLSYPHSLISVALGEDSSTDKTYQMATRFAKILDRKHFRRAQAFHLAEKLEGRAIFSRDDPGWQLRRRSHLAKSRNQLLQYGLEDEDWVLWIDSDVKYIPPDLIQHFLSAQEDVVAASCLYLAPRGDFPVYDRNSWQETTSSKQFLAGQKQDYLMLEGYDRSRRKYLPHLTDEGQKVPLDGVGGCALFVRADCHRKGLIFPTFVFEHHIETEGLAKLAKKMNFSVFGLPSVNVFHF